MFRGKNLVPAVLVCTLLTSTVTAAIFGYLFVQASRELRNLQTQAAFMQNRLTLAQSLVADCVEYSKRNPALDPILQGVGAKTKPVTTPAAAAPAKGVK